MPLPREISIPHIRYLVFVRMWAVAAIFHQASYLQLRLTDPMDMVVTITALFALWRPERPAFVFALLAAETLDFGISAPRISNHWWIVACCCLSLGITTLVVYQGRTRNIFRHWDGGAWLSSAMPSLRIILLMAYFFAVFHKLNWDFLDPEVSCSVVLADSLRTDLFSFLPSGRAFGFGLIAGTLLTEVGIPTLLISRRTRHMGVLLGVGFHFMLGFVPYNVYYNFSSVMATLLVLFLDDDWFRRSRERIDKEPLLAPIRWLWQQRQWLFGLIVILLFSAAITGRQHKELWQAIWRVPWFIYGTSILGLLLIDLAVGRPRAGQSLWAILRPTSAWYWLMPALFLLNGFAPYLGLKTEYSLSMFSNIRVEGGSTNHVLVTTAADPFGRIGDVVEIIETSDPRLQRYKDEHMGLLWFEFQDLLARRPEASVEALRNGEVIVVERAADDDRFKERAPIWLRKLIRFRPVDLRERTRCGH